MNPFTSHPASVGETYGEHCVFAFGFGVRMVLGGAAAMIHAVFPFLCLTTASSTLDELSALRTRGARKTIEPGS